MKKKRHLVGDDALPRPTNNFVQRDDVGIVPSGFY